MTRDQPDHGVVWFSWEPLPRTTYFESKRKQIGNLVDNSFLSVGRNVGHFSGHKNWFNKIPLTAFSR